jgi:hypothetical protein
MFLLFDLFFVIPEIIFVIFLIVLTQKEKYIATNVFGTIGFILLLACVYKIKHLTPISFIENNWELIGVCALCYVPIGFMWSLLVKWVLFLYKFRDKRAEAVEEWNKLEEDRKKFKEENPKFIDYNPTTLDGFLKRCSYKETTLSQTPRVRDYKGKVIAWAWLWPLSMIGTLLDDFVRNMMTFIYNRISWMYQSLADKIVPKVV